MATNRELLGLDDEDVPVAPVTKPRTLTPVEQALQRHKERLKQEAEHLNAMAKLTSDDTRETEREIIRGLGRMI